jgi:5-methyltetrahydrofolate--homocysteine methyltransferase
MFRFDGGYGTMFYNYGMKSGENSAMFGLQNPEIVKEIHNQYLKAGANVITVNTFSANSINVPDVETLRNVLEQNLETANSLKTDYDYKVALDIGPLGQILKPIGPLHPNDAYNYFKEIIDFANNNYDIILIETFSDILEAKMAVLAAKENSDKPVFVTFSITDDGKTVNGNDLESIVAVFEGLSVDCIGLNCGLGPKEMLPYIEQLVKLTNLPILIQANAGLPEIDSNGETSYPLPAAEYIGHCKKIVELGVEYIGGCCGTTPSYIEGLTKLISVPRPAPGVGIVKKRVITSGRECLELGTKFVKVGESINPSSSKDLKQGLLDSSFSTLKQLAIAQKNAAVLDVNVSVGELRDNEPTILENAVLELSSINNKPLQFDSSNPKAIEQACRVYGGIPIINSAEYTLKSYPFIFPIVKKYGAFVILLPISETGIPKTVNERIEILQQLINIAINDYGINIEQLIYDPLVFSVATEPSAMSDVISGIEQAKKLGVLTSVGLSNISFGMPNREEINNELLDKAKNVGLDMAIMSVFEKKNNSAEVGVSINSNAETLEEAIVNGMKEIALTKTEDLLKVSLPLDIINEHLIPALNEVGQLFEDKKIYLPQLLSASEAAISVNELLSKHFTKTGEQIKKNIVLATVKNDIHDIGKNIVGLVLKANGYNIYDLGKDVEPSLIVEFIKTHSVDFVALSALMTTTINSMEDTIKLIRDSGFEMPIFVGGAALSEKIAKDIGADFYSDSPINMLKILKGL